MDVITIESKAYHELMGKIEKILRYVEKEEKAKIEYENRLVTNDELAEILGISKRTYSFSLFSNLLFFLIPQHSFLSCLSFHLFYCSFQSYHLFLTFFS